MTEYYPRTTPDFDKIPQRLKDLKLWTVWEIPQWERGTDKPKKIPRTVDGKGYPTKGYTDRKEFGSFEQVIESCKGNPDFYPGLWLTEVKDIICLDYDSHPEDPPMELPKHITFGEHSVYSGYHFFAEFHGETLPKIEGADVRTNSWIVMTGNTCNPMSEIENLSDVWAQKNTDEEIGIIDNQKPKYEPVKILPLATSRHPELKKIVSSGVARNHSFKMILAACQAANEDFPVPKTPQQVEHEVLSLFDWATRKQTSKVEDDTRKKEERHILLPGGVITPEMKKIIDANHPNVSIAHCLNMLIGLEAPDGGVVRWNKDQEAWFFWNGKHWQKDVDGLFIVKYAEEFLYRAMSEAAQANNKSFVDALLHSQSVGNIKGAMFFLKSMVAVQEDIFDTNETLFNIQNGTVDLKTFTLLPFNKNDYITRIGNVSFDRDAISPKWDDHLNLVIPDEETRKAFQVYMGYTLIGGNAENTALFLFGGGKNGKSETVSTISHIHGSYQINCQPTSFYERMNDDGPRPDIARMKGARFIGIPEGKKGKPLDEGLIKQLTGGDIVTARYLYGREFDFIPTGKLVFFTNHLPRISGRDVGIWRRIFPVPFTSVVPQDKRIKDYHKILIEEEAPGIFNWMLTGLRMYYESNKLLNSKLIEDAKQTYKDSEDVLADFLDAYVITGERKDHIKRSDLYAAYKLCITGDKIYSKSKFNEMIAERLGDCCKDKHDGWIWCGIRVKLPNESIQESLSE